MTVIKPKHVGDVLM